MSIVDTKIFTVRDRDQFLKDFAVAYLVKYSEGSATAAWATAISAWEQWVADVGLNQVHFMGDEDG